MPDTAEKKSYLFLDQPLKTFSDGLLFLYFQKFLTRLALYLCKEFLLPILSGLLAVVGLRVSFYLPHLYLTILLVFSFYLFFDTFAKVIFTLFPHITIACQGVIFTSLNLVKNLMEKTHTNQGLCVVVNVVDKIYEIGRKVSDDFKKNLKIVFDEYLPKWNYRAVPQITKQSSY